MLITDPRIYSYKVMTQREFWSDCADLDGKLNLGLVFDENKLPREDCVLVIDQDAYGEIDEWVTYNGQEFFVDMELYTAQDIMKDAALPKELYPTALAYYLTYDAYLPHPKDPFVDAYEERKSAV
ncbi:hypothetical protein [uncultured Litoreibacter sp.]|uniref:hypothetical protein n=1 Tax=uncultured Litoreibacter sp. TaxID=1392394 RepID=UPI0026056D3C|nr:hypothetical protein [uncultured Litoreibacter sp.]